MRRVRSPAYVIASDALVHGSVSSPVVLTGSSPWGERLPVRPGWGRSGRAGAGQGTRGGGRGGGGGAGHRVPGRHPAGASPPRGALRPPGRSLPVSPPPTPPPVSPPRP